MNNKQKLIYYSLLSGDVYEIAEDEIGNLDDFQVPLIKKPKSNCKRCYGRGYIGRDRVKKYFIMCNCIKKYIDKERIGDINVKY